MTSPSLAAVPESEPKYLHCSPAEIEAIGHLVADGASNEAIARRLGKSVDTIKTQLQRVYRKAHLTNASCRTELAVGLLRGEIVVIDPEGRRVRF